MRKSGTAQIKQKKMKQGIIKGWKIMKEVQTGRAWIEVDRDALRHNVEALRSLLPEKCRLMPAVKADAYGHGAVLVAKELNLLGIDAFCVASAEEGIQLRENGIRGEILVLGYTHPQQYSSLEQYDLIQTVIDYGHAEELNGFGRKLRVHVGIDTGMHRLGERCENIEKICRIFDMENLQIDGIFTHLCAADGERPEEKAFTKQQSEAFYRVADELEKRGYQRPKMHLQSSYGILNYPELSEDYARVGIALYGVLSSKEDTIKWKSLFRPVLSLKTRISSVRDLYAEETAGYGMQFTAGRDMKIASLAIGYADGLPRALSQGRGDVLINGCKVPIIGRICMDQTLVDVSEVADIKAGDFAVVIGRSRDQEISVCDVAEQCGTITNEILSRMGARLSRIAV